MSRFLIKNRDGYSFRRRVPASLQKTIGLREIYRSLTTSSRRIATARAAQFFILTEELFRMATPRRLNLPRPSNPIPPTEVDDRDMRAVTKFWLDRLASRYRDEIDHLSPGEMSGWKEGLAETLMSWDKRRLDAHREIYGPTTEKSAKRQEAEVALLLADFEGPFTNATLDRLHDSMVTALDGYAQRRWLQMSGDDEAPPAPVAPPVVVAPPESVIKPSPKFTERFEAFLSEKCRSVEGHRGYAAHTAKQARATAKLFLGIIDERPVREYSEADAEQFRLRLLELPQSFGKSRRQADPKKAIKDANIHDDPIKAARRTAPESAKAHETLIPRLKMKTVKRHFSQLAQYWAFLKQRGHVDKNIFLGWEFPGTRSSKISHRDPWAPEHLKPLFTCKQWKSFDPLSAGHWFPLIALHTGMRLDEIAALRVKEDVAEEDGVLVFRVMEQIPVDEMEYAPRTKEWTPKTIASVRRVPVHSWLIAHGVRALIDRRRREGAERLFPEMRWNARHESFSAYFSRDFSKLKTSLGLGKRIVFHGFRVTFRTEIAQSFVEDELLNALTGHEDYEDGKKKTKVPERLIDATVGVAGERGVGAMYERPKLFRIEVLRKVVESFNSPLDLSFLGSVEEDIKAAPSDKHRWAVNLPPAAPRRGRPAKGAVAARTKAVRKPRKPAHKVQDS